MSKQFLIDLEKRITCFQNTVKILCKQNLTIKREKKSGIYLREKVVKKEVKIDG